LGQPNTFYFSLKREVASVFACVAPCDVLMRWLSTGLIPLLIYARRPGAPAGGPQCCVDPFTDCTVPPACGCFAGGPGTAGALTGEYAAACPASAFATATARDAACDEGTEGALGSVGLVGLLVGVLSLGQCIVVGVARRTTMRPDGQTSGGRASQGRRHHFLQKMTAMPATLLCTSLRIDSQPQVQVNDSVD
jgi:hypothetical protein